MKKLLSILAVTALLVSATGVTTFAHGRGGRYYRVNTTSSAADYSVCPVDNCTQVGLHQHNGGWYCDRAGVGLYDRCAVDGCAIVGIHEHDGTYYCTGNSGARRGCCRGL